MPIFSYVDPTSLVPNKVDPLPKYLIQNDFQTMPQKAKALSKAAIN